MNRRIVGGSCAVALAALLAVAPPSLAREASKAVLTPVSELQWGDAGIPGVQIAPVRGDRAKGPSHFFLKYAAGLATPVHHHSADHYVTVVSGTLSLSAGGREAKLPPGSYFAFTGKAAHVARVEGDQDCVMFVDSRGAWDVVAEAKAGAGAK
jgi:anti-sigma factor ChrR (cupin superfamily)